MKKNEATRINKATIRLVKMDEHKALFERITKKLDEDVNLEIKKTDNIVIYFNDTCPSKDIYYVIFFTGKEYKRTPDKNILPKLLYINGYEFVKDSPWIATYIDELTALKDKYARGPNKKNLAGIMEVYPRPTFKANIAKFLGMNLPLPHLEIALSEDELAATQTLMTLSSGVL